MKTFSKWLLLLSSLVLFVIALSPPLQAQGRVSLPSKVYQPSSSMLQTGPVEERISNFCELVANVFYVAAIKRDKGERPNDVYASLMASELPDSIKQEAPNIIKLVYVDMATVSKEDIGFAAYTVCMQRNTGIRRNT